MLIILYLIQRKNDVLDSSANSYTLDNYPYRVESHFWRLDDMILNNYKEILKGILDGTLKLTNDRDATIFASWKVSGQDFYVYARKA